jgi:hypothetical protein
MWRLRPIVLMGAAWALLSVLRVRWGLKRAGLAHRALRPPRLRASAEPGVRGVLTRLSPTCLERALVWQAWLVVKNDPRDVVIGILPSGIDAAGAPAHAWVDGTDPTSAGEYRELHRIPASQR